MRLCVVAALKPAAPDFRILWDNAMLITYLRKKGEVPRLNIFDALKQQGADNLVIGLHLPLKLLSIVGMAWLCASTDDMITDYMMENDQTDMSNS